MGGSKEELGNNHLELRSVTRIKGGLLCSSEGRDLISLPPCSGVILQRGVGSSIMITIKNPFLAFFPLTIIQSPNAGVRRVSTII